MKYSLSDRKQFAMLSLAVLALGLFVTGAAPAAHADALFNFTLDGCSGGCGPQTSFGTINLHSVDAQTVQITVSLLNGNQFVTTGSHTGFSFNIQGGAVTVGTLPTGWADAGGPVTQPGFGVFSNGIDCTNGNSNKKKGCDGSNTWVGTLQFEVSRASGLTLSDFVENKKNNLFAVDILSGTTGNTGLVAANLSSVPELQTLALLGTGVLGIAGVLRRKLIA